MLTHYAQAVRMQTRELGFSHTRRSQTGEMGICAFEKSRVGPFGAILGYLLLYAGGADADG